MTDDFVIIKMTSKKQFKKIHHYLCDAISAYYTAEQSNACLPELNNTRECNTLLTIRFSLWQQVAISLRKIHEPAKKGRACIPNIIKALDQKDFFLKIQNENYHSFVEKHEWAKSNESYNTHLEEAFTRYKKFKKAYSHFSDKENLVKLKPFRDHISHSNTLEENISLKIGEIKFILDETIYFVSEINFFLNFTTMVYGCYEEDVKHTSKYFWKSLGHGHSDLKRIRMKKLNAKKKLS